MRYVKHGGVLLFVLMLLLVSVGESLAFSQLTTEEMAQIEGQCRVCVYVRKCTEKWCPFKGWACQSCTENATNESCTGVQMDPDCAARFRPLPAQCGVWSDNTCDGNQTCKPRNNTSIECPLYVCGDYPPPP